MGAGREGKKSRGGLCFLGKSEWVQQAGESWLTEVAQGWGKLWMQ